MLGHLTRHRSPWPHLLLATGSALLLVCPLLRDGVIGTAVSEAELWALRGGDTDIGERATTCNAENGLVPNCPQPPNPGRKCEKCSVSSGTKLVKATGNGWEFDTNYDCGVVARGTCDANNICVNLMLTDEPCRALELVRQQSQ